MNHEIRFYGYDVIRYYWYVWQNAFSDYPWQIYIAWLIVVLSIVVLLVLAFKFFLKYRKNNKVKKKMKKIDEIYHDKIKYILSSAEMSEGEIVLVLGENLDEYMWIPEIFILIITNIHMELNESYFPNMLPLCNVLNITDYCENNLLKEKNIFKTLQFLCINNLIIMEGRLAKYVNHKDNDIRMMSRLCYIFCTYNEPYKYLEDELNSYSEMMLMFLHFIFVWMKSNNKNLPNFNELLIKFGHIERLKNFIETEQQILC